MRRVIALLSFIAVLYTPGVLFAQKTGKPRIDSLLAMLPLIKTDTARCNLYSELSFAYLHRNPVIALSYADKLMVLAKKTNWKKGLAQAYNSYGNIYNDRRQYGPALENLTKNLKISEEINYINGIAAANNNIAIFYGNQNNREKEFEYGKKAIPFYLAKKRDAVGLYRNMAKIGLYYRGKKQLSVAKTYFEQLLKLTEGNPLYQAYINVSIGDICHIENKNEETLSHYKTAEQLIARLKNTEASGFILETYANYYFAQTDTAKCIQYYKNAASFYASKNNIREATDFQRLAFICYTQNDEAGLIAYDQKAADICEKRGDDGEATAYQQTGGLLSNKKKYDLALLYSKKALAVYKKNENKVEEAQTYQNIGYLYLSKHNYTDALNYFKLSTDLYGKMNLYENQALGLSAISSAYLGQKDYSNALAILQKEIGIAQRIADKVLIDDVNNTMVDIYNTTHNFSEALNYEFELKKYATAGTNDYGYNDGLIAETYKRMGNYSKALEYGYEGLKKQRTVTQRIWKASCSAISLTLISKNNYIPKR